MIKGIKRLIKDGWRIVSNTPGSISMSKPLSDNIKKAMREASIKGYKGRKQRYLEMVLEIAVFVLLCLGAGAVMYILLVKWG
jgi:hypothetical protein